MIYLLRNNMTNVIEMMMETPVTPSPPLEVFPILEHQFRPDMLNSIYTDPNLYKPYPSNDVHEHYWISDGTDWIDPRTNEEVWEEVRRLRDEELAATDWTQLADSGLTPGEVSQWAQYRTTLRDAPMNASVGSPRVAEVAIKDEKDSRKPGKDDNDPRRGRGHGKKPEPRRN